MSNSSSSSSSGLGFFSVLGIVFIALKLTGYINWSWWWVTLPFWGSFVIALIIFTIIAILSVIKNR